mgnify:CR=1 FL=1
MKNITKALLAASLFSAFVLSANTANALTLRFGFEPPRNDSQYFAPKNLNALLKKKPTEILKSNYSRTAH